MAGAYEVHVRLVCAAGEEPKAILGSPFLVNVGPNVTHASTCAVRWETSSMLMAGDTAQLWIQARDCYVTGDVT